MEKDSLSNIKKMIRTRYELEVLLDDIDDLIEGMFKKDAKVNKDFIAMLEQSGAPVNEQKSMENYLHELSSELDKMEFFKIDLAFNPSDKFLTQMHDWVGEIFGKDIVLDVEVNKDIIGGAIVTYDGRYVDASLSKVLGDEDGKFRRLYGEVMGA